ncbi:single-stranded DNA-binding protein [Chryseobacterium sp. 2987]|uniref:single-stranded DNA-binding protein n=1 Tax=Chryseobacterium sp. 2987 TaxID=2817767 RepID=UPI002855CFC4|nr:single-stranded DNA-binding protein [Chryseobacterium sp. 2987]MDR6919548.1 single-strand DNA-binding protein [Chryseobacterium sp. 2987]
MNITGRITRTAEVRTTASGKTVVNFSIGNRHTFTNKEGNKIKEDTYFDCSYWRTAKIAPYLTKGTIVELSGRISPNAWMDKEGKLRAGLNFHVSEIQFHGSNETKQDNTTQGATATTTTANQAPVMAEDNNDDLPF